jgi:hypothetical protein
VGVGIVAWSSSETSVLIRATRRNNPEDIILHSHCRENLKSYRRISNPLNAANCRKLARNVTSEKRERERDQTPWLLVRKQTIPTDRLPLVGKVSGYIFAGRRVSGGQRTVS